MNHDSISDYMAHGFCFSWEPGLVWLHVTSDILTGLAYYVITAAMGYYAYKRRDVPFMWVFLLFALFILACGTTHFFAAYTVYRPEYWPEGIVKAFTALISIAAAIVFIPKIPHAIVMPSLAKTLAEVQRLNAEQQRSKERLQCVVNVLQYDAANKQDLLDFALNEALRMTSSRYGYIYYYDEEKQLFTLNSWSHDVMQSCRVANPESQYELDKTGIWGEAVRQRKAIMVNDFAAPDPLKKGYPEGHVHLTRFLTIPQFDQGRIVAVVGMANKEDAYDDTDLMQLTLLMDAVWKVVERKRIESELTHKSALLRSIIDSIPDLIFYKDTNSTYLGCNKAFEHFAGRTEQEQAGKTDFDFFDQETARFFRQKDCEMLAGGQARSNEEWITYPDGRRVLLDTLKTPFWGPDGTQLGLVGISRDITERKEKERQIEEKNAELERFIYTVSHDLKSPLVTISSFLGYLETDIKSGNDPRIQQDIGYIRTAADKMGQLLTELLELSRVGRVIAKPVRVEFREVVLEALQLVAGHIAERGVQVTVAESPAVLCADRSRLVEIWQNLVENSVKYMGDQAEPLIEIGVEEHGESVQFFVRDNGMGIDPRHADKIFGLFEKLDKQSEGTGLGLALVKRIVEMFGGTVWVESEGTGRGSCFRFTLPEVLADGREEQVNPLV
jgi:PAS domain S-box-containing protein